MQLEATAPQSLVFENPGSLELALVKLLGVSVKDSSAAIGFFGTGLKYALAAGLRLGGSITIIIDGERHEISSTEIVLREKSFTQVTLDGEPLGFTTELGKQWEPWMVVRELYSNALDEGGRTYLSEKSGAKRADLADRTLIVLRGECFVDVWRNRSRYFIDLKGDAPVVKTRSIEAYPSGTMNRSVFYRGINVKDTQKPLMYRYNVTDSVTLTEDRTLKYDFQFREALERSLITSDDRKYIYRLLTAGNDYFEGELPFSDPHSSLELGEAFSDVCSTLLKRMPAKTNRCAVRFYQRRTQEKEALVPVTLTPVQTQQLQRSIDFVRTIGCDDLDDFPIQVVRWLGEGIHGRAQDGNIYLSVDCFDKGTKYLASTLFEEYVHCKYGFEDETRELQTWLFDRVITMGEEHITGAAL